MSTYICGCPWAPMGFCGSSGRSTRLPQSEPERDFRPNPRRRRVAKRDSNPREVTSATRDPHIATITRGGAVGLVPPRGSRPHRTPKASPNILLVRRGPPSGTATRPHFRFAGESDRSMHPSTEQRDSFQAPSVVSPKSCRPLRVTSGRSTGADRKAHHPTSRRGVIASELA